ncbi:nitrous oxidase accessory protein [Thermoplasmatales archaeon SCGC AB-540-F20]|nr:nitrous oxidase accessory protein [Thermoplasmatales archaeon SCGC AB-540-F20]
MNVTDGNSWSNRTFSFTTESMLVNGSPVISYENPVNGSIDVSISLSSLGVMIEDPDGDSFNWSIETSPYIGSNSGTGEYNGTKTCDISGLEYATAYRWYANVTDSGSSQTTNTIYTFTTESETSDWGYFKKITIDHTMVDEDLTNFPILVHNTSIDFINHAQSDGDDFLFMDSTNTTQYNHEIERYDNLTGELIAWVNITKISSTVDTILWLNYGNSTATNQENVHGVWDSNYHGVYHMNDKNSTIVDSTSNNNNGTLYGNYNSVSGNIGDAIHFEGDAGDYGILPATNDGDKLTALCWFNYVTRSGLHTQDWILSNARKNNDGWRCYSRDGDGLFFYRVYYENGEYFQDYSINPWGYTTTGQWYFTALSYENGGQAFDMINDNIIATHSPTDSYDDYHDDISLASNRIGNAYCTDGIIDEVRISIYPRNISWVKTTYNTTYHQDTFLSVDSEKTHLPPIDTNPPEITNVNAQPNPQNEGGYVNITCDVTDNIAVDTVMVNITYPDASTINTSMLEGSYYFNTTYTQIGTYSYFIWANDTNENSITSTTYTFTIQDSTLPEISNVADTPDPQEVGGHVNITCDVTDNIAVDTVMVNITYPDASTINTSMLEGSYYYNSTYSMVGTYSYFIWAQDSNGNVDTSATFTFNIQDTTPPEITNVIDTPDPQEVGGYVNITCDVTDNVEVDTVTVDITYPDASSVNVSMLEGSYYYNTIYTQTGTYTYFIWANDTYDNSDISTTYNFEIIPVANVYVDDDYDSGTPGWGITHFDNIQDGIDAVSADGTVHVNNGLYSENVIADKSTNLVGENKETTIIDGGGSGDVMVVSADYVNISGFTITNSGSSGDAGIDISSDYNIITSNNVSDNDYGIYLTGSSANLIYNNIFNNTNNGYDNGINTWNISKTFGTNLIGGSYLGGNYWSDYSGADSDGDGLGDTPYNIPGGSNQDLLPLVSLATTLRLVPESTTVPGYTNVSYDLLLEYLQNGLSGYNITLSISNPSVASTVSIEFPSWAVINEHSSLPSDSSWMKAIDLNNDINGDVSNVLCANITIKALNAGTTFINLTVTRLDDDNGQSIIVHVINSSLTVTYVLPPLPGHQNSPTDPDGDGLFEDLNGNGALDFDDVVQFFQHFEWIETNYTVDIIDFNDNGYIDFDDIVKLFEEV